MADPLLVTTSEAAEALAVSRDTILRLVRAGRLAAVDVSTGQQRPRLRIRYADLQAFADTGTTPHKEELLP